MTLHLTMLHQTPNNCHNHNFTKRAYFSIICNVATRPDQSCVDATSEAGAALYVGAEWTTSPSHATLRSICTAPEVCLCTTT